MDILMGSSSLLFLISLYNVFVSGRLFFWKISNMYLTVASFLYNSNHNNEQLLTNDLFAIFCVCSSYINYFNINQLLFIFLSYEYSTHKSIETTKNITFFITMCKSLILTYYTSYQVYFWLLCISYFLATVSYLYRRHLYYQPPIYINIPLIYLCRNGLLKISNYYYYIFLTWILHLSIASVIWISSITAV